MAYDFRDHGVLWLTLLFLAHMRQSIVWGRSCLLNSVSEVENVVGKGQGQDAIAKDKYSVACFF